MMMMMMMNSVTATTTILVVSLGDMHGFLAYVHFNLAVD